MKSKERLNFQEGYMFGNIKNSEGIGEFRSSWRRLKQFVIDAWQFGLSDPRKIIFSAKMGLALVVISLLIFLTEPLKNLSNPVWAILTVIVVFEFSIGATLSKGLNRALGTLSAGCLALATAELSTLAGEWERVIIIMSIFIIAFFATFLKLQPTMKQCEYGFRVFLLTYCYILVSGYRTGQFFDTALTRFLLIAFGAGASLGVNIFIYPIWAGEDLHSLVAKNFIGVATSLEACVNGYLQCVSDDPLYKDYRSAVESTSKEDALLSFAIWEPPHGKYKMLRYPWKNFVKVSASLRHCAFTVMTLHGCILSEIQAPPKNRQIFSREMQKVGNEGAKVLRELGNKVKNMEKISPGVDILLEVHEAAEELQKKIDKRSYLFVNAGSWKIGTRPKVVDDHDDFLNIEDNESKVLGFKSHSQSEIDLGPVEHGRNWPLRGVSFKPDAVDKEENSKTYESASALSLATFASLLIEFVARLQNLIDSFEELSKVAKFKEPVVATQAETGNGDPFEELREVLLVS